MAGYTVTLFVAWSIGTDVVFEINFDDGTPIYVWNWEDEGHTISYQAHATTIEHMFADSGNYTLSLPIHNDASTADHDLFIIVEPNLDTTMSVSELYIAKPVPVDALFSFNLETTGLPPVNIWCEFIHDFSLNNDSTSLFIIMSDTEESSASFTYTVDKVNATPVFHCENHVSKFDYHGLIKQQENFTNVTILSSANVNKAIPTQEEVIFSILISEGSHAVIEIDFGDGTTDLINTYETVLSYVDYINVTHIYAEAGTVDVKISFTNFYFNVTYKLPYQLLVQNKVQGLTLDYTGNVVIDTTGTGSKTITVHPDDSLPIITNVSCFWELGSGNNFTEFSDELSLGQEYRKDITFIRANVGLARSINISCFNLVSTQNIEAIIDVYELISGMSFVQPPLYALKNNELSMLIFLEYGSHVTYRIELGNGDEETLVSDSVFGSNAPYSANLIYTGIGNFTPNVIAFNEISEETLLSTEEVIVQNEIAHLEMSVGPSYVWPPGTAEYTILAQSNQEPILNMHCHIEFGYGLSSYTYFDSLSALETVTFQYSMSRVLLGNTTANATCGNMVTNTSISATTEVILDAVILKKLLCNETVLWTNTTLMILDIKRFGQKSCFEFEMGDSKDNFIYGSDEFCRDFAVTPDLYYAIEYNTITIFHEYVYPSFGEYNVTVFAFNHVSNDTIIAPAVVLDWPCFAPNISFANESDVDIPLKIFKSVAFIILPEVVIDCMKTQRYTNVWSLISSETGSQVHTQGDELNIINTPELFVMERRVLSYGNYTLVYSAGMFNVTPPQNNASEMFLEIISTPLIAGFSEGNISTAEYNTLIQLDLIGASFDPDVESKVKSEMTFEWLCRESYEEEHQKNPEIINIPSDTVLEEDIGGCFGNGPGKISISDGILRLNTYYLRPNTSHLIDAYVHKDDRVAFAQHQIRIEKSSSPVITLRYVYVVCLFDMYLTTIFYIYILVQ